MYAVVEMQGHQYIVQKGTELVVDRLDVPTGKDHSTTGVLAVFEEDGKTLKIGKPYVEGATVSFDVVDHTKGDKMHVAKFKNKNRYHKKIGFRPKQTLLTVKKISI